jgi:integrase
MPRRGRGEGSITKRADGRWMARVDLGWRDGRRRYKSVYGRTRRQASDKLTKALREVQQAPSVRFHDLRHGRDASARAGR